MELARIAQEIFSETGVLQHGHFRLTSGRHSDRYMQCARLFEYPDKAEILCRELAGLFADKQIDCVVGPAVGAVQMAFEVSRHLHCRNMFAERENSAMTFRRGFFLPSGARVLVVEDTITTGGSVREVIDLLRAQGGVVVGVGAIVDRSGGQVLFDVPMHACVQVDVPSWAPDECALCREGQPLTKPGSRT
ncbi:MAG: orotate phosphoribosyltransferase [Oscillospiraceae bacterium]|jgi:orotate phosphoribosyltransferase|nr:orotate phosphoribosyltransferase [Oscillospiraceae bacterium]